MKIEQFDFPIDESKIAQSPVNPRDSSKLLVCKSTGRLGAWSSPFEYSHKTFHDIADELNSDDLLVLNNAKVLPVRLLGHRVLESSQVGGEVEALLLKQITPLEWSAILRLSAKIKPGIRFLFEPGLIAEVLSTHEERTANEGEVRLKFSGITVERIGLPAWLERYGVVPLPPYISTQGDDRKSYQTVYAQKTGSAAAPTAGFHFTDSLFKKLEAQGVQKAFVTLHIGIGTFRPIKADSLEEHVMHEEVYEISDEFIAAYVKAKKEGKRIVAVGTTVVRALESWAKICEEKKIPLGDQDSVGVFATRIFIKPGFNFQVVDDLVTNFHLPRSSLLVLVAGAMDINSMRKAYDLALENDYRFFSYGDAMFIRGTSK